MRVGNVTRVFEDEEHDKAGFRSLRPSFMPNFSQKPVFRPTRRPKNHGYYSIFSISS